ncbi:MAG: zinc ABC transporter substrate-binding protein [Rhodospirillales bacterium]|nr:zinc ABC transporter substrate-binding protein [Rhodospirillales bacterium]
MSLHKKILFSLFCLFFGHPVLVDAADISVAVSIKPVHSLVAGIMAGVGEPSLIVKGSRSPHSYSLKPSDARTLTNADVIVWIGPSLEMFLEKSIGALSGQDMVITLHNGAFDDPHLWLAPTLAISIVEKVQAALTEADPVHADIYKKNASALKERLQALQSHGISQLAAVRETPFLVFHDAWGHFAKSFGLSVAGAVALNPERPPGAKRIITIRRLIDNSGARCLFREPQFESPLLSSILEDHEDIKVFELDPLGSTLQPGPDLYFQMMEKNIAAVSACLK